METDGRGDKTQKRLQLLTSQYNKLLASHAELQTKYDCLIASNANSPNKNSTQRFPAKILSFVKTLLFSEKFSDVSLKFETESPIPCHSFVLEARGFSHPFWTDGQRVVHIGDISRHIGSIMIKWMYTDFVQWENLCEDNLIELLRVSSKCTLEELRVMTEQHLIPCVEVSNVIKTYQVASQCSASLLMQHCTFILFSHWNSFSSKDFESLDTDTVLLLLEQSHNSTLHSAISLFREDVVYKYVIENMDKLPGLLNEPDESGQVPLFLALKSKQQGVASLLVSHGADVNIQFSLEGDLKPILHHMVLLQDHVSANFLLDNAQCNIAQTKSHSNDTILHALAQIAKPSPEVLNVADRILESRAVSTNSVNSCGDAPLHVAISNKSFDVFSKLLSATNVDVNKLNGRKEPPLWLALSEADVFSEDHQISSSKFSAALLERGAKVNAFVKQEQVPLLNACAERGLEQAAIYLLNQQFAPKDINAQDSQGYSVLHVACKNNLPNLVVDLLRLEADCNLHTKYVEAEKPRPPVAPPTPKQLSAVEESKEKKKTKKKVMRKVEKLKPVLQVARQTSLNPFDSEFEDTLNPFLDDVEEESMDQVSSVNPFEDEVEEETEWVEEWVTDEENQSEIDEEDGRFGNALTNKFSFFQQESVEEVPLVREASFQTPLHLAIWHKHEHIVQLVVDVKREKPHLVDLEAKNSFDQTAFALALWLGLHVSADCLLKVGSNIDACNSNGECLLQQAIMHQDSTSALFLLEHNADFSFKCPTTGDSALMCAIKRHLPLVVDALCIRGADMAQVDRAKDLPLWVALESGQEDVASILVRQGCDANGWHVSKTDGYFQTLLHRAIKEKNEAVGCFLVRCGSGNVDFEATFQQCSSTRPDQMTESARQEVERQDTPGHLAARVGLPLTLEALLEQGFKVNCRNAEKKTCLHVAIEADQFNCIDVLMSSGDVSLSAKDSRGITPFGYTLKMKNDRAANLILQREPSAVEHLDNRGRSLLHIAVQTVDLQAVLFLITCGANVNGRMADKSDMTSLHVACISTQPSNDKLQMILRNLILAGANVDAITTSGQTGLHLAAERGSHELCCILIENGGANVNVADIEGDTPLHLAVKKRHVHTIKRMLEVGKGLIDLRLKNARGRTVFHTLAASSSSSSSSQSSSTSVMSVFPLLMNAAEGSLSLNDEDADGNTMLLLSYINGHSQLCRALVSRGVALGKVNKQGLSMFTYPSATDELLHSLLKLVSTEPSWSESDCCLQCGTRFTVTLRRHHCRHCGRSLCASCSSQMSPIPKFHLDKPVRVCAQCFHVIRMGGAI